MYHGVDGSCTVERLELTRYVVTAKKEEDGYPDLSFGMYSGHRKNQYVKLTENAPEASVSIPLGPKAGVLVLKVTNAVTGAPIADPKIILREAANPTQFLSTGLSKSASVLLPADEDILLEVRADGYRLWQLPTPIGSARPKPLHLQSSERVTLSVDMQPQ
jgi:hypothetical protein